jgi:FolB domain-containing protein
MIIRIKNLRLRTITGINDWERKDLQDVVVNAEIEYDGSAAVESDEIADSIDYKAITKRMIREVEQSRFQLLDKLSGHLLAILMEDERVQRATVEIDKPGALRFADSVSVTSSAQRER